MENIKNKCNCNCSKEKKVVNTYKAKDNKYVSTETNKLKFEFIEKNNEQEDDYTKGV